MTISIRQAQPHEIIRVDEEAETLPEGVRAFDSTDWDCCFLSCLVPGDHVVEIPVDAPIANQSKGTFVVHKQDDGGFFRRVN